MRLWRRISRGPVDPDITPASYDAIVRAEKAKMETEQQWDSVTELVTTLRQLRERNHFVDGFRKTL